MDHPMLFILKRFLIIKSITQNVKQTSQSLLSDRNGNSCTGVNNLHIPVKTLTGIKHDAANHIVTDMLRYFHNAFYAVMLNNKCIPNGRKCFF